MPSYGIHLIILDEAETKLRTSGHAGAADILAQHPDHAALGAMGPDLYFFAPDMAPFVKTFVDFIFDVYEVLEPFIDFYDDYIAPIESAISTGVDWLTGGLWDSVKKTITMIEGDVMALMTKLMITNIDLFQYFEPNMNKGKLEEDWFWIEMGHGRRTGQFGRNLLDLAGGDDELKAYGYGYLTHIIGDVVGHPFVNQITGGPFRTHWHRHHLVENYMDVWAWDDYKGADILSSHLDQRMYFGSGDLPKNLTKMIDTAFRKTYRDAPPHIPSRIGPQHYLSPGDIEHTYTLFRKYLEMATSRGIMSLPKPVPPALIPGLGSLFSSPPSSSGGGSFSWSALWNWIKWLFEQAFKILTLPIHILASLATYQIRYLLYLLQMLLYQAYKAMREALVLGGYVMCEPADLTSNYALDFTRQRSPAPSNRWNNPAAGFPLEEYPYTVKLQHQIDYPPSVHPANVEFFMTESSPYPAGSRPDWFIDKAPHNPAADALATAKSPSETQGIDKSTLLAGKGQLGNAVDWCGGLIGKADTTKLTAIDLPDWNLDADRGYGWKSWKWQPYAKPFDPTKGPGLAEVEYFEETS